MRTTTKQLPIASCRLPVKWQGGRAFSVSIANRKSQIVNRAAFTLIELLVVIAIMAILAAFTFGAVHAIHRTSSISAASAELGQIKNALENYKAKYGTYPPSNPNMTPLVNTLYYELSGVTVKNGTYTTLDGACSITQPNYKSAFTSGASSIDGIINCTKGTAEEGTAATDFLQALRANRIGTSASPLSNGVAVSNLVTSVRGPDQSYAPLGAPDVNPFRYSYPGTNNPSSYDLWIQLVISGKTNLICNWNSTPVINSPLP